MAALTGSVAAAEPPGQKAGAISSTTRDFEMFLASLPRDNVLKSAYAESGKQRTEPVFIFIPGILGSKLVLNTPNQEPEVAWGCVGNTISVSENLSYDRAPKLTAEPLLGPDSPPGDCAFDVYNIFFKAMTYSMLAAENTFLNFAYDWRQPNEMSAEDLDKFMRKHGSDLDKRKVVIIAHSMGGLVFKWWYFHHYLVKKGDYHFDLAKIFFVGTPHNGSFAAVHALKHGHALLAKAGTFLGWLEQQIAPALNRHGLTFPSFYQLLPYENEKVFKAKYVPAPGLGGREYRIDLFTVNAWKRLGLPNTNRIDLPPQMNLEKFYETRLGPLLKAARDFNEALSKLPLIPIARYAFNQTHETATGLVARDGDGITLSSEVTFDSHGGDGTVFLTSAKNARHKPSSDHMIGLNNEHANLIVDKLFIDRIFDQRAEMVTNWEEAARIWATNEKAINLLAEKGILLPTATASVAWQRPKSLDVACSANSTVAYFVCTKQERGATNALQQAFRTVELSENNKLDAIGSFNVAILDRVAKQRGVSVGALSAQLYASAKDEKNSTIRKERYLAYIGVEKLLLGREQGNVTNYAWAQNNLGSLMLQQGETKNAFFPLKNANTISKEMKINNLFTTSTKNLGMANRI
jgi:hypothetical protein